MIHDQGQLFRVNGEATIVEDPELLAPSAVEGKDPRLGILVSIRAAYTQCSKARGRRSARGLVVVERLEPGTRPVTGLMPGMYGWV